MNGEPSPETVILYRVVLTYPPTIDDMRSDAELGITLRRDDSESRHLASGISLFDSPERARKQARRKPWMGNAFIAELVIPAHRFQFEKTAGPGHRCRCYAGLCTARGARLDYRGGARHGVRALGYGDNQSGRGL